MTGLNQCGGQAMSTPFKVGDAVHWNSEAGEIRGKVVKVHTRDVEFMGRHRPASKDEPQYEVKSDKTGHLAMHHGAALHPAK
ncbi:Hva1_TUDOR domain-containing protein [Pseudomonas sp. IT-347P]